MSGNDQGIQQHSKRQESVCSGQPAEVTNIRSQMRLLGPTTGLSLSGCFVEASNPFVEGTTIRVSITHNGMVFEARGWVVQSHLIGEMKSPLMRLSLPIKWSSIDG